MRKLAQNAKPITEYPGIEIGDRLAPNALRSLVGTIRNDFEIELDPHPATDNVPYITTFYNAIRLAKDYAAQLQGLSEDPVKARTSYAYGMSVMKDPRNRSIIAYSRAYEFENSEEGKAKLAKKQSQLQAAADAKLQRELDKKDKIVARQAKDEELLESHRRRIAELEARIAARGPITESVTESSESVTESVTESSESVTESKSKPKATRTRSQKKKTTA
ncbi:MAG: hypothetical protein ISN29_00910 [Gammaproteobacteria bacterium AqS3]|nr:hypothetical protein [Gammaproteobacteria bacterium AqS3]